MEPYAHGGLEASLGGSEIAPHDAYAASIGHADSQLSPDLTQDYSLTGFQGLDVMPEMAQDPMQDYGSFHHHNHVGLESDFNGFNPAGSHLDYGMPLDHLSSGIQHAEVFQGQEFNAAPIQPETWGMQHQSFEPMPDVAWGHDPMGTMVYSPVEDHCLNTHQTRLGYSEIELAKADNDQANQAIADRDWYLRHDDLDRAVTAQQQADQSAENRDYHLDRIEPTPSA